MRNALLAANLLAATLLLVPLLLASPFASALAAADYDPLRIDGPNKPESILLDVRDPARERDIPLRVYLPADKQPAPLVLFSHGLGGTRDGCRFLGEHWVARGYVAVFLQHPGSDDSVWRNEPLRRRMAAMREAASGKNFMLRVRDVPAVLDQLQAWSTQDGHPLAGRLDVKRVGMSGHSFGAVTTQAVSGQSMPLIGQRLNDERIQAAVIMSPSGPRRGDPAAAFDAVKIPWLLMTGTKDLAAIGDADLESRRSVYPNLPANIDRYELVLDKAEHSAFTDRALPGDSEPRNPNHHRAILALSTAFWDTYLRNDPAARTWLLGEGARGSLEPNDIWQLKTAR